MTIYLVKNEQLIMMKQKVFAYITQNNHLLVFRQPDFPEAGIQVPAGTLRPDETPEIGVLREAQEETRLNQLSIQQFLGEQIWQNPYTETSEIHHRYFFHLHCHEQTPPTWLHGENDPSEGVQSFIRFELFWVPLIQVPTLIANHDYYLETVRQNLI